MLSGAELRAAATKHHALIPTDNDFQRRARLQQSLWRASQGITIGEHRGDPLGSRIEWPHARAALCNFLTETIRAAIRREVLDPKRDRSKLYGQPRIFNDLLSSQPLAFNLFAELQADLALASRAFGSLTKGRVDAVTRIEFEYSPGRGDPRFTGDRSAFDVYAEYTARTGARGFIGIEVKYHEDLGDRPSPHKARYDQIADATTWFLTHSREKLKCKPIQQIWRDHLLACSLLGDRESGFDEGQFVFLYPAQNTRCATAVEQYRACLTECDSFEAWTLEDVVAAIKRETDASWIDAFHQRYLAFP